MNDKPAATQRHGTGSGEATWMHDAAARINQIQAMRGHVLRAANGDTNPVMPEDEMVNIMQQYAPLTPPASPTVTIEDVIAKYREACDEVIRNAKPYIESASDWPETQHRMQAITAPLCAAERFHDDALALLRAAERQK